MPSRTTYSSRRAARDFLRRIREVYKLVSDAELGHVWLTGDVLVIGHRVSHISQHGWPVPLSNGMYLNVELTLAVTDPTAPRLATTRASYAYQYDRNAPFPYPRCHLHVFAASDDYLHERPFSRLHLPTRRITLEQTAPELVMVDVS